MLPGQPGEPLARFINCNREDIHMAHTLSWYMAGHVLALALDGQPSLQELRDINEEIIEVLDRSQTNLNIIIDAVNLRAGYQTADQLRSTQHYMNHPRLANVLVISDNKLNRLITLMAFCLSRAHFIQFDTHQKADAFLRRHGAAAAQ
ncbi:MAG: hypothetical protein ACOCXZ_02805 [Chloroflexota bacterium]